MSCYMNGYMDARFFARLAEGIVPKKKGKIGGEEDGLYNSKND